MLSEIGSMAIGLALVAAAYAASAAAWALRRKNERWEHSARNAIRAAAGLLGLAVLLLLTAFLSDAFQIRYVAHHSSRALPVYLKASAVWAGQEGSLLLWAFLQSLFAALATAKPTERSRPLIPWVMISLSLITAFFVAITLFLSNPFVRTVVVPIDGQGMNPLLRHPAMILHPPALYLGYVGLAVPWAFAVAALITRRVEDWPDAAHRWTLVAWLFLGAGLLLGMRWAYDVLGWGGYWGWDPVENAGLMPWLTATALLHGLAIQRQRSSFRSWNVVLAVLSFTLVLFGTFATRSGIIASVHAFARSPLGHYFLALIGLLVMGSIALMVRDRSALSGPRPSDRLLSRDGMFFLTLVLLLTLTASIWVGSVLPTLTGGQFEAPAAWFDRVTGPQFAALVLLMGVCPLLRRSAQALHRLRARGWPALLGMALAIALALTAGLATWASVIGLAIVGLAGGTAVAEFIRHAATARRRTDQNRPRTFADLLRRDYRPYGATLVHAGVILMALGVIGTRLHVLEAEPVITRGVPTNVGPYTLLLEELRPESSSDHASMSASLAVYRDNQYLTTLEPQIRQYADHEQVISVPALRPGLREDLYVVLADWEQDGTTTFKVFVNPFASFLWIGGLVLLAGGAIALWPSSRAALRSAAGARRPATATAVALTIGLLAFVAAAGAMWWPMLRDIAQAPSRPLRGQPAPDLTVEELDGSTLSLSELRGDVVVINFWASWCEPCEKEMPELQAVWEEYESEGVIVLGIALDEEASAVKEITSRLGITFPLGVDTQERASTAFGVTAVPETFVVDADGRVAYFHIGPVRADQLRDELDQLLGE